MKKKIRKIVRGILIILFFITLSVCMKKNNDNLQVNAEMVSNEKIGWGIKRNNKHEQPDVGEKRKKILEENGGICLGNKEDKSVYLTFDEGYEAGYTMQILDVLKENNVKAVFFLTGHYINTQPEIVKRMIEEEHIIGNHTVNHKSMPDLDHEKLNDEIMNLHKTIYEKFGYEMKYLRPPKGEFSERTLIETNKLGYKTVMWSFAYEDWNEQKQPEGEQAKEKILENLHNGEIMLLHGNSKTNTNILNDIIQDIKNEGYVFKSLDDIDK